MGRYRRKRKPAGLFDLVLPVVGFLVLAFTFVPGARALLIGILLMAVLSFVAWAIWRNARNDDESTVTPSAPVTIDRSPPLYLKPTWTRGLLSELEWKRFEDVVAAYSQELGYEAVTTRVGADGGVDVKLFQSGNPQPVMIIQCKAWDAYKVGIKPVRELFGVMAADKVANGAFFTTGEFTAEAEEWARDKNLDLVNGREFLSRIGQLPPTTQNKLLIVATEGDYTTPTCPSCNVKMILRTATKGANAGSEFWGCRSYPRCKQTFRIVKTT
jgi:restriction system protein